MGSTKYKECDRDVSVYVFYIRIHNGDDTSESFRRKLFRTSPVCNSIPKFTLKIVAVCYSVMLATTYNGNKSTKSPPF
jgi:hypothetical protein